MVSRLVLSSAFLAVNMPSMLEASSVDLPRRIVLVPSKVLVEPFSCPATEECLEQARPRGNPASWLNGEDYPPRAERENQSGSVVLELEVDRSLGRASACKVVRSSTFDQLDKESCRALQRRARFLPQSTVNSRSTPLRYSVRVVWMAAWVEFF
jgi:TonB family protein